MAAPPDPDESRTFWSTLLRWAQGAWGITILGGLVVGVIVLFVEYGFFIDEAASPTTEPGAPGDTVTSPPRGDSPAPAPLAVVTSDPRPWDGQSQRSSSDFSVQQIPPGTTALRWEIEGEPGVTFDVLENITLGLDPPRVEGLRDGAETRVLTSDKLYIANPVGAEQSFVVRVYPVLE